MLDGAWEWRDCDRGADGAAPNSKDGAAPEDGANAKEEAAGKAFVF